MEGIAVDELLRPLLDKAHLALAVLLWHLSCVVFLVFNDALLKNFELLVVTLEDDPFNEVLEQGHAREVTQEAPRLLVHLHPIRVELEKLIVVEELTWLNVDWTSLLVLVLHGPLRLDNALREVLQHAAEEFKEVASD